MLVPPDPATYRHEAFFYDDDTTFVDGVVRHLEGGFSAGEAALVVVGARKIELLRHALGADCKLVQFADMADVGRNPARIIPAWQQFVDAGGGRGVGEPIYPERSPDELLECQHHESLLNLAFAGTRGFHLLCPYDVDALPPDVLEVAGHTHPVVNDSRSETYLGTEAPSPFCGPLRPCPDDAVALEFTIRELAAVRARVRDVAGEAGLSAARTDDLLLGVNEVAINSVTHGGGCGILRAWVDTASVICQISDAGQIADPLVGRVRPPLMAARGRGMWVANQVCDLVQIRSGAGGTTVRIHVAR